MKSAMASLGPIRPEQLEDIPEGEYTVEGDLPEGFEEGNYSVNGVEGGESAAAPAEEGAPEAAPEAAPAEGEEAPAEEMQASPEEAEAPTEEPVPEGEEAPVEEPAEEAAEEALPQEEGQPEEMAAGEEPMNGEPAMDQAVSGQTTPDQTQDAGMQPGDGVQPEAQSADPEEINSLMEPSADIDQMRIGNSGGQNQATSSSASNERVQPEDDPNTYDQPKVMTGANLSEQSGPEDKKLSEGNDQYGNAPKLAEAKSSPNVGQALVGGGLAFGLGTLGEDAANGLLRKSRGLERNIDKKIQHGFSASGDMTPEMAKKLTRIKGMAHKFQSHHKAVRNTGFGLGAGLGLGAVALYNKHDKTAQVLHKAKQLTTFVYYTLPH
jgi:hypothetical protein